jgi:uncharacterized membrane protein
MMTAPILFGLLAAITWGTADFNGGIASKRSNPYGVVVVAHSLSLGLLIVLIALSGESIPSLEELLWGGASGIGGGIGLLLLYRALAEGRMSVAAPVSAVVASGLSVLVGAMLDGIPGPWMLAGLILALIAVWFTSREEGTVIHINELRQPVAAGICFALFFICFERASQTSLLWPLIAVRVVSISSLLGYVIFTRQSWFPNRNSFVPVVLSGVLDTAGNALYALSARSGRLDVAAVISSLYPGVTVLLAWLLLREWIGRMQTFGILLALAAIIILSL